MIRQGVNKVEVEITEELREIMEDHKEHSEDGLVKDNKGVSRGLISLWSHIHFEEQTKVYNQVFEAEVLVIEDVIRV